jgi:uncharacterized cupin superfamily protein
MSKSIVLVPAGTAELKPARIPPDWILAGKPETMNKELARSADRAAVVFDWSCTAGQFKWHYAEDEILVVVSGEAFITDEHGREQRLGPGDMGFFPAGSSATWRVTGHVRKFAMVRTVMPTPVAFFGRAWRKLTRMVRRPVASPLTQAAASVATLSRG